MDDEVLTIRQVAAALGLADDTVASMAQRGAISARKIRGHWCIRQEDLDAWKTGEAEPAPTGAAEAQLVEPVADADLAALLASSSPLTVFAALDYIREQVPRCPQPSQLRAWATLACSARVRESAESQLLLAEVVLALIDWHPTGAMPNWRGWEPIPRVHLAWLRAEFLAAPERIASAPEDEYLYQVVRGLAPEDLPFPERCIEALVLREEPFVAATAIRLLARCAIAGCIAPSRAYEFLLPLCTAPDAEVAMAALAELSKPWACGCPLPEVPLRKAVTHASPEVAVCAVNAMVTWEATSSLELVMKGEEFPERLRCTAMQGLGATMEAGLVTDVLAMAASDPLLYGLACVRCLEACHERGIFVRSEHLPQLLFIYTETRDCAPELLARLTFTCRGDLATHLAAFANDDERWPRLVRLLEHVEHPEVLPLLLRLLANTEDRGVRRSLIEVLGRMGSAAAEEPVLALLEDEPRACLAALRSLGGRATLRRLQRALGLSEEGGTPSLELLPHLERAIELAWHLAETEEERDVICRRLNPARLPRSIRSDLQPRLGQNSLRLLVQSAANGTAAQAITRLCATEDSSVLAFLPALLVRHIAELLARPNEEAEDGMYEAEPVVASSVRTAIRSLGSALWERGCIRPRALASASRAEDAGEALLASLVFDLLARGPIPEETRMLLEVLESLQVRSIPREVRPWLRNPHPQVRKMAIRCLVAREARGSLFSLARLTEADDIESIRQALVAIAAMKAAGSASYALACLAHGNMNIKKAAAAALCAVGDRSCLRTILFWLGRHDNPGFRARLLQALAAIAGKGATAALLSALEVAPDARSRELLLGALDSTFSEAQIQSLVRGDSPAAAHVLGALASGSIALASGSMASVLVELGRRGIAVPRALAPLASEAPMSSAMRDLAAQGWSRQLALRLLADGQTLGVAEARWLRRHYLAEWLALLPTLAGSERSRAAAVLVHLPASELDARELELLTSHVGTLIALLDEPTFEAAEAVCALATTLVRSLSRARALEIASLVRALSTPRASAARLRLLRATGAQLTSADVLALADRRRDLTHEEVQEALEEAFQAGPRSSNTPPASHARDIADAVRVAGAGAIEAIEALVRELGDTPASVRALIDAFPLASSEFCAPLLALMCTLQPLNTPSWTLQGRARLEREARRKRAERSARESAMRGAAWMARTVAQLEDPEPAVRSQAAERLLGAGGAEAHLRTILRGYLLGALDVGTAKLPTLGAALEAALDAGAVPDEGRVASRLGELLRYLSLPCVEDHRAALIKYWTSDTPGLSEPALSALRRVAPDTWVPEVAKAVAGGQPGYVDLLGGPVSDTPQVRHLIGALVDAGQSERAEWLRSHIAPSLLCEPQDEDIDLSVHAAVGSLSSPASSPQRIFDGEAEHAAPHARASELLSLARGRDLPEARAALKELMHHGGPEVVALARALVRHRDPKMRSLAHRCLKKCSDRTTYLEATFELLDDSRTDVQRSAVRTLSFARYEPAIPRIIELLVHKSPRLRKDAHSGLVTMGEPARAALHKVLRRARPDVRPVYQAVLGDLEADADDASEEF